MVEYFLAAVDSSGVPVYWPIRGEQAPRRVYVGASTSPPEVEHDPVTRARPGESIEIRARVSGRAPLARVTLLYRNVNQFQTHDRLVMTALDPGSCTYAATIPGDT